MSKYCVILVFTSLANVVLSSSVLNGVEDDRILYGEKANIEDYPYFVGLGYKGKGHNCGATILTDLWVLTAGHCVDKRGYVIAAGAETWEKSTLYDVEKTVVHPKYEKRTLKYDLALIKLKKRLEFGDKVKSARLPPSGYPDRRQNLTFIGRGTNEHNVISKYLMKMQVDSLTVRDCQEEYDSNFWTDINSEEYESLVICIKRHKDLPGACFGDSGSALLDQDQVVGVASFIPIYLKSRCTTVRTAYMAKVEPFIDWINEVIKS